VPTSSDRHGILKWLSSHHCADLRVSFYWAVSLSVLVAALSIAAALVPMVSPANAPYGLAVASAIQILTALVAANLVYFQFVATSANGRAGVAAIWRDQECRKRD
jgi:hypothetical protein